jgi:predicted DNA-binding transcriptional regulator AlpA
MLRDRSNTVADVCGVLGISRATLYRYVRPDGTSTGRISRPK